MRSLVAEPSCNPASSYGAIANDGIDDRFALESIPANTCVDLAAGTYDVDTPAWPRPYFVIQLAAGVTLQGVGPESRIAFRGNTAGHDWFGIGLASGVTIQRLTLDGVGLSGTEEQTHIIGGYGPMGTEAGTDKIRLQYLTINHPVTAPTKRGDCIRTVGYEPQPDGTLDKRIWRLEISHVTFAACARSGWSDYGACHDCELHDSTFADTKSQDYDGEGQGGSVVHIHHNTFSVGPHQASAFAIQTQYARASRINDNIFAGRGVYLAPCAGCELDHNKLTLTLPAETGAITLVKGSAGVNIHDNEIAREASSGVNNVFRIQASGTSGAPSEVTIADSTIIQHTAAAPIGTVGIVGLYSYRNAIVYDAVSTAHVSGIDATGGSGTLGIRTTGIEIVDTSFAGPLWDALKVTGTGAGTGIVSMVRSKAAGASHGLICENIDLAGKVLGPITYVGNSMPAPICGTLVPP